MSFSSGGYLPTVEFGAAGELFFQICTVVTFQRLNLAPQAENFFGVGGRRSVVGCHRSGVGGRLSLVGVVLPGVTNPVKKIAVKASTDLKALTMEHPAKVLKYRASI